jgi:formate dehydrogenase major subunit
MAGPEDPSRGETLEDSGRGAQSTASEASAPDQGPATTRRGFLKGVGAAGAATLGVSGEASAAPHALLKTEGAVQTTTVCPFCGVGCGQTVFSKSKVGDEGGDLLHIEGDTHHPISEGTLCSKGASLSQVSNNERRLKQVMYRAPGSTTFEPRSWDWAFAEIAKRVKKTRDESFQTEVDGRTVNRTEAIACLGGAALDNEECYLLVKAMRMLGLTYIEHQARI